MFAKAKIWLAALAVGSISVMWAVINYLQKKNAELETENTQLSGQNEHLTEVLEADISINEQTDTHLVDVVNEIKGQGFTTELSEPNKADK